MNEKQFTPLDMVEATGNNLRALRKESSKVIRAERFSELQEKYGDTFKCEELAALINNMYKELESEYGISVPAQIVVDSNEQGETVIAAVVDRVDGRPLDEIEPTPEIARDVEQLYMSIARYLYEKNSSDDYYLTDINNPSQYMYGSTHTKQIPSVHLVDTDIYFSKGKKNMYLVMEWLARHMSGVERQFGVSFTEARRYLQQFVEEAKPDKSADVNDESYKENLGNIQAFLRGEKFGRAPEKGTPGFSE